MISIVNPVPTPTAVELPPVSTANTSPSATSFADQMATAGENLSSSPAAQQDAFLQSFFAAVSPAAAAAATAVATPSAPPPVVSAAVSAPATAAEPSPEANDAPQETPAYTISSTPPYFTPAPDQSVMVTPSNGMSPFPADSMDSYMQKVIGQSVSNMYGFINGTQSWANGGAPAITNNFISMVQQRLAVFPSMAEGIDPVAMGTQYANVFMNVLSNVPVSHLGATNFTGSVMDFLSQGGSPAPTVLNQAPSVMNAANA